MVRKTIHITEAQVVWLEDSAYNVSSLVRKVLTKIMRKEIDFSAKVQGTKAF